MFKKILSLILVSALMCSTGIPFAATATESDSTASPEKPTLYMDGEVISETEDGTNEYTYVVEDLSDLPVLSCSFDKTAYSVNITQPTRENGYIGCVTVTELESGSITEHTVKVFDNNTFQSHFINLGGDPWVTYHDGWYYYMYTGNGFFVSKSRELERVNSNPVSVFNTSDLVDGVNFSIVLELWAPELHFIDGHWYIYFTAYDGESYVEGSDTQVTGIAKNHRMYVLKSKTDDAQGEYEFMGQINELEEDYINDSEYNSEIHKTSHYAIDQTVFEWDGKLYAVWSGWSSYTSIGQRLFIAEMSDPCTISSNRVELSRPEFAYETYSMIPAINEAPQALISPDGKTLNLAFSVNRFDDANYALGLLTLKEGGDPLNADDWVKSEEAVFETNLEKSTYSVGHCSFVPSPDNSEYYMIYHARAGEDTNVYPREVRVKQFYWYDDGTPCFGEALGAEDLVQIPSGTAIIDRTKIEAENGTLAGNAFIPSADDVLIDEKGSTKSTYTDDYYSGGKRVALTSSDSSVTFSYTAEKAGKYTLTLLAAGNSWSNAGLSVTVNETEYTQKITGNAISINTFYYYDITDVELAEGENSIVIAYTSTYKNGAYLDRIDITNQEDAVARWTAQDEVNLNCTKTPVIREKVAEKTEEIEYDKEYCFDSFGDFDKYWYNSQPFRQEYGNAAITTVRPGGNKRLLVSDKAFHNIADFKASVEITPSAAHTATDNNVEVQAETVTSGNAISSGIVFRIGEMRDYTSNVVSFSGYRCFLIANSKNELKIQAHKYYFTDETSSKATPMHLSTSSAIAYTPGETYILEIEVIGNTLNAVAYSTNDPETTVTLSNVNLKPDSSLEYEDYGRIGLYSMPANGRVTFDNLKITPYYSSAGLTGSYGKLNELEYYDTILPSSRSFSEAESVISIPTGVSKLLIKDTQAQAVESFKASARFKITQSDAKIQAGIAFRVGDCTTATPGLTGYVVYLQRTSSATFTGNNIANINVSLTKYGKNKNGTLNANCGTSPNTTTALLSDKSSITDIVDTEIDMEVTVIGNILTATVSRADKPEMSASFSWILDSSDNNINIEHNSDYYENGRLGIFSNGFAEVSHIQFEPLSKKYNINASGENGNVATDFAESTAGKEISLTLKADSGYYINPDNIKVALSAGSTEKLELANGYWDTAGVYTFTMPESAVSINYHFTPILSGDSDCSGIVNLKDLVKLKKHLADIQNTSALSNSDMDSDNLINATDLTLLRKYLLEK